MQHTMAYRGLLCGLFGLVLFGSASAQSGTDTGAAPDAPKPRTAAHGGQDVLSLRVQLDSVLGPVSPRVFGIHAQGLYDRRHPEDLAVFETEEGRALLQDIEFGMVRFPAGTASWGYRLYEADGQTLARGLGRYVEGIEDRSSTYPRNALFDLFDFCALTGVQEVSYVYNPLQPVHEAMEVMRRMEAQGLTVVQVELGNEYQQMGNGAGHGKPVYRNRFPTPEVYLEWCAQSMDALRAKGYQGAFALVCANVLALEQWEGRPSREPYSHYWDWNAAVKKFARQGTVSGTTHQYLYHGIQMNRSEGTWQDYIEQALPLLVRGGSGFLNHYIKDYYGPIVPGGINLTEWAVKWPAQSFGNTLFEAQHVVRFLLDMNRFNLVSSYPIQSAFYQKLGGQITTAMITHSLASEEGLSREEHQWRYKAEADYHAFRLFKGLVHGAALMAYTASGEATRMLDEQFLRLECFRDSVGQVWAVVANAGSRALRLEGGMRSEGLHGDGLLSGMGFNPSNWNGKREKPLGMDPAKRSDLEFYSYADGYIPPFSVGKVLLSVP